MDPNRFDAITRTLGTERSRRGVLKTLGAAALGALGVVGLSRADAAPSGKVLVCHHTGSASNPYVLISVSANAAPSFAARGDTVNPDLTSDPNNCGGCGIICTGTCTAGQCECPNPGPGSTYSNYCDPNPSLSCTNGVTTLTADCLPNGGPPTNETSIVVNSCASANYVISNCNGILTCGNCPP